jgi:DNA polymerase-3 subunit gamma/tau
MAPELVILPSDQVDAIADRARQLGAAGLVRAIELLGSAMVEMRQAPDPRILVEVALVQLTNEEAGTDTDALLARIERLESTVKQLRESTPDVSPAAAHAPRDPTTGRAVLGGAARSKASPTAAATAAPAAAPAPAAVDAAPALATAGGGAPMTVPEAWEQSVKGQVKPIVRALYSVGSFVGNTGDTWQFSVPNEAHGAKCGEHRPAVEAALAKVVGSPVTIEFVVGSRPGGDDPSAPTARPAPRPAPNRATAATTERPAPPAAADDEIDLSDLTDAPPETVKTPLDRLAEAFPGSEFVSEA